jgi:hypothetical protein
MSFLIGKTSNPPIKSMVRAGDIGEHFSKSIDRSNPIAEKISEEGGVSNRLTGLVSVGTFL